MESMAGKPIRLERTLEVFEMVLGLPPFAIGPIEIFGIEALN